MQRAATGVPTWQVFRPLTLLESGAVSLVGVLPLGYSCALVQAYTDAHDDPWILSTGMGGKQQQMWHSARDWQAWVGVVLGSDERIVVCKLNQNMRC